MCVGAYIKDFVGKVEIVPVCCFWERCFVWSCHVALWVNQYNTIYGSLDLLVNELAMGIFFQTQFLKQFCA